LLLLVLDCFRSEALFEHALLSGLFAVRSVEWIHAVLRYSYSYLFGTIASVLFQ
jgi:hypothetical protein